MFRQLLAESPLLVFPIAALTLFFVAFATIVARVLVTRAADWEARARLPLDIEEEHHG